ncbi:MAG: ABC transporter permease subunit, partial [Rhodospirillaceae bacterium]|nr:ABC transporter permease subunit [Rhodospirillaceae bacterium]
AWQGAHHLVGDQGLASPWETIATAAEMVASADFWPHAAATAVAFAYALLVAMAGGLLIGLVLGYFRLAGEVFEPIVGAIYSIPKITLYPIILLVFGLTLSAKVAFGALHGIFPMIIFTMSGVKAVRPVLLKTARAMRLSPGETIRRILVPAALPEIFTGFRIGFSITLLGTLIGELFASDRGLGFLLIRSIEHNDTATILALTMLLFAASASVGWLLLRLDRRLHRYRQVQTAGH